MAARFSYFSLWRIEAVYCHSCHWRGSVEAGVRRMHGERMDFRCPVCEEIVAIIPYPTLKELAAAAAAGNVEAARTLTLYQREAQLV